MRPESDEHNADDHGEDETEKTTDEEARKHDRGDPDGHRHQDSHAVASWMEQAPERPDEQPEHHQADDMKNHNQRLPGTEGKKTTARRCTVTCGGWSDADRIEMPECDPGRAVAEPRPSSGGATRLIGPLLELHEITIQRNVGVEEVRSARGEKRGVAAASDRNEDRSLARRRFVPRAVASHSLRLRR
jgi:hypothetical protein